MWDILDLDHERVDDIPLILGLASRMKLPEVLDQRLGRHHLHQGLSPGWLARPDDVNALLTRLWSANAAKNARQTAREVAARPPMRSRHSGSGRRSRRPA